MAHSHSEKTLSGLGWNSIRVVLQTLLSLLVLVIFSRLLPPEEIGLMAVITLFLRLVELVGGLGLDYSTIRQKRLSKQFIKNAFSLSVFIGMIFTVLSWFGATHIDLFFPDKDLHHLIVVTSVCILFNALATVPLAILAKQLNMKVLCIIDISTYFIAYVLIALSLVLLGWGIRGLVWGTVFHYFLSASVSSFLLRKHLGFCFDWKTIKMLINQGAVYSGNAAINFLANNIDKIFVGKFMPAEALGYYSRSSQLVKMPILKVAGTINHVMFPAFSAKKNMIQQLVQPFLKLIEVNGLILLPILTSMLVGAELIIIGLLGSQWQQATVPFQLLCAAGMFKVNNQSFSSLIKATGQLNQEIKLQCWFLFIVFVACLVSVEHGVGLIAFSVCVAACFLFFSMARICIQILDLNWRSLLSSYKPGIALASLIGLADCALVKGFDFIPLESVAIKLIVYTLYNVILYITFIFFMPKRWVGDLPCWLVDKLQARMPGKLIKVLNRFSPHLLQKP